MHLLSAGCVCALTVLALLQQVAGLETVTGLYGDTLEIPCNNGAMKAEDILMIKWKYNKGEGLSGDLVVQQKNQNASDIATDEYKGRVSLAANSSLLISAATLSDQRRFTCMVVALADIAEFPVNVVIHKTPSGLEISKTAEELEIGKPTKLGTCVAKDANPASDITWFKNNKPLATDGKGISIETSVIVDPVTSLSTTISSLEYSAEKEDKDAQFTCSTRHAGGEELTSIPITLTITYSTETVDLHVTPQENLVEGDSVTLRCVADGNPAPTSFIFHLKGETVKVDNADTYNITNISRETSGEYKCSLPDDASMEASNTITVNYLDIDFSPTGSIVKAAGDVLIPTLKIYSSGETKSTWWKDGEKLVDEPNLTKLAYSQSGTYECEVTMGFLSRKASFELVVEGAPVIKQLSQKLSDDGHHKVLICQAEGFPKPAVSWSINGTLLEESDYVNGQITHRIKVVPAANLTVSCVMSNDFGTDAKAINVSSLNWKVRVDKQDSSNDSDQTKLVVGVVVGLLVATAVIGLAYWVYMKKSKQGSWKTGEKECGSSEEEKKLEEKVEENSQKAEV